MKFSEVPKAAYIVEPTPVPMKSVPDWDEMLRILKRRGFVIIETDDVRITTTGAQEAILVKAFNSHLRSVQGLNLRTKRISINRWYCVLA
jgi:hypothetical protein